jgi:hypothetical protein
MLPFTKSGWREIEALKVILDKDKMAKMARMRGNYEHDSG